jgi:Rad3-related DNA helicase
MNNLKIISKTKPNSFSIFLVFLLDGANRTVYITNKKNLQKQIEHASRELAQAKKTS